MGILTRVKQKIFGDTGDPSQFGKIGSESAGSPATTKDLALIQSLSQYLSGLYAITGNAAELPRIEDINALYYLITSQLAYGFQAGVPEYDSTTDYFANISVCQYLGILYMSKTGTGGTPNTGNTPSTSPTNWRPIGGKVLITSPATESTLTILDGKTFTVNKTLTLDGTDGKTLSATASITLAGTDGKTLTLSNNLTFAGTDGKTLTISNSLTLAGVDGKTLTVNKNITLDGTDGKTLFLNRNITLEGSQDAKVDVTGLVSGYYQGLLMTYVSTTSFSVGTGSIGDSTFVDTLTLLATTTKTTSAWAVGTGNGGLDTGAIGASAWYAVFLIKRPDTGVVDVLYSLSSTAPTLPANYTLFRRIGWVRTNGSSQFIQWQQSGREFWWMAKVADASGITPASTNRILLTVTAPKGAIGIFIAVATSTTNTYFFDAGWTALTDSAAAATNCLGEASSVAVNSPLANFRATVDSSNQIYYRVNAFTSNVLSILTLGWVDNL